MRHGWEIKKLGEVCKLFTDGDWIESKDQADKGIRLIQTGNIGCGEFNDKSDHYRYISEETFIRLNCTEIYAGDILISRLPDPIGRSCIIPQIPHRMITAVDCTIVRPENIINPNFLVYYTNSGPYQNEIKRYVMGAVRKRISRKNLFNIPIPVPPLSEQERIVAELDLLSDVIAKKREQLKQLDTLAQSIFYDMFGDPITNEKGWETKKLGEISTSQIGITYKPEDVSDNEIGTIVLRSGNIQNNSLCFNDIIRVNKDIREDKYVKDGDILMCSRNGSSQLVGKVAMITKLKERMTYGAFMTVIRSDYQPFLFAFFKSPAFRSQLTTAKTATINQITIRMLEDIQVILPPLTIQQEFASKIEAIDKQKELIKQSLSEVQQLFDSRMDYYFN